MIQDVSDENLTIPFSVIRLRLADAQLRALPRRTAQHVQACQTTFTSRRQVTHNSIIASAYAHLETCAPVPSSVTYAYLLTSPLPSRAPSPSSAVTLPKDANRVSRSFCEMLGVRPEMWRRLMMGASIGEMKVVDDDESRKQGRGEEEEKFPQSQKKCTGHPTWLDDVLPLLAHPPDRFTILKSCRHHPSILLRVLWRTASALVLLMAAAMQAVVRQRNRRDTHSVLGLDVLYAALLAPTPVLARPGAPLRVC